MNKNNQTLKNIMIGLIIGIVITFVAFKLLNTSESETSVGTKNTKEPLYWVAPMDPNYKRDQPGKSPMGMDLIPFYGDEGGSHDSGPGTVRISPAVVNNLGVRTEIVKKQTIHTEIKTVGYVQYDEDLLVHIHPRVEGWVEKLYVKTAGNPVTKGQVLYEIYSPELVNAQEEYILALGRNNERLIKAAQDRLKSLQLSPEQINQLKKSRDVQQRVTFYAPQSGVVDELSIREGNFVKPGNTMMSIGSLEEVWVEAEVFERQANLLALNQKVTMTLDFLPGKKWLGEVDYIYPTLDANTRTLKVRLRFNNEDKKLKPNMFAQITIHSYSVNNILLAPIEAVIRTGSSDRVVLALDDGKFKSIKVKLGRFYEEYTEILAGLEPGDKVVSSAQFLLDSESSKTSDFKRMTEVKEMPESVWVEAIINDIMVDHNMLNVTHQPIDAWDWPEMTMDFILKDGVDISQFSVGEIAHIEIEKIADDQYQISGVHIQSNETPPQREEPVNHDDHDMENMATDDTMSLDEPDANSDMNNNSTIDHSNHNMDEVPAKNKVPMDDSGDDDKQDINSNKPIDHSQHKNQLKAINSQTEGA
jgi:Cu(I)/Ag(I) efflux system membrane fusion protein